ncbi:uncharacterized protein LOC107882341 [Acyrthosiphon pisum]|uniref:Uncharacterized protein n=1 Tax=Acyrthosiphon pisum TaxID=7029 RepID=A0A8R2D1B5_ACYPI|nr:uncharacterized protein LOC107882341 [Acyrthosiphon pisum]|eukprot:XP_016656056.1 PREDICTED: uncharacterized protein LOC107882341 [Acyrthosiphon pisum]
MSYNSDQIQPQFVPPLVNDVTSKHLQYSHNNINSYPTFPLNVHLPVTSPSTNRNMPTYYQPYITVPHTSFVSTLTPSTSTRNTNMQHTPHALSSAPTPEPPVTPTDTTTSVLNSELINPFYGNYYSESTN